MLLLWLWYYDWLGTATLSKGMPFDLICWMDSSDLQCKFGVLSTGRCTWLHIVWTCEQCDHSILWVSHGIPSHFQTQRSRPWCADRFIAKICCWPCNSSWRQLGNSRNEGEDHVVTNYFPGSVDIWCRMMQTCFRVREIKSLMWFMMFHVVTVVEANAGMLLWSSVYENSALTGHLAVDLSWAPCLRRSSFPSPFSFPNGIGTPKTSVPRLVILVILVIPWLKNQVWNTSSYCSG
jgi:hypothetical protein